MPTACNCEGVILQTRRNHKVKEVVMISLSLKICHDHHVQVLLGPSSGARKRNNVNPHVHCETTWSSQDAAYIYVVSEPYYGGDLTTCAQRAAKEGVALNQHWLAGILRQICVACHDLEVVLVGFFSGFLVVF